ncbi:MAG: hypothetical protein AAFV29_09920, partial [Myxococcota bacterium]
RQGALHTIRGDTVTPDTFFIQQTDRTPDFFAGVWHRDAPWAAGDSGLVVRGGLDGPQTENSGSNQRLLALVEVTPTQLIACGEQAAVRLRRDDWQGINAAAPASARITGGWSGGDHIVLTTDQGVILERAGGNWSAQTITTDSATIAVPLFDVWSSTVGADLFVVGLGGTIFRRTSVDAQWTQMPSPGIEDLYALDGRGADEIYAVGAAGTILQFDGGGWSRLPSGTGRDLFDIRVTPSKVIAVGDGGAIVRRND